MIEMYRCIEMEASIEVIELLKETFCTSGESSVEGNMQSDFLWKTVGGVLDDACGTARGRDLMAIGKNNRS